SFDKAGYRLAETRRIDIEQVPVIGKLRLSLRHHLGKIAPGVMLEMPLVGHYVGIEPFQFTLVRDQLAEQSAQFPLVDHPPAVEYHCLHVGYRKSPRSERGPPFSATGPRRIAALRPFSPGGP